MLKYIHLRVAQRIKKQSVDYTHGRRQRGAGGPCLPPWIFKFGTNIVDRGLKVLFFGFFCYFSAFFAIFRSFFRCLPSPLEEAE